MHVIHPMCMHVHIIHAIEAQGRGHANRELRCGDRSHAMHQLASFSRGGLTLQRKASTDASTDASVMDRKRDQFVIRT